MINVVLRDNLNIVGILSAFLQYFGLKMERRSRWPEMEERRTSPRTRMFKAGKILFGTQSAGCTVRNLSETGACLEIDNPYGIPGTFEFVLPERPHRMCKVIWANGSRKGVQFT
jgi:hypothetical protein